MSPVFHLSKINSYQPIVSDVSDDDLMETVKQIEKSENVISPIPKSTCTTPFDVFKTTKGGSLAQLGNLSKQQIAINLILSGQLGQ